MKRPKMQRHSRRYGAIEMLEARQMLTSWQNPDNPHNVDNDPLGAVSFDDAKLVLGELQSRHVSDPTTGRLLSDARDDSEPFIDVDGDGYVSPIDFVRVLNSFFDGSIKLRNVVCKV